MNRKLRISVTILAFFCLKAESVLADPPYDPPGGVQFNNPSFVRDNASATAANQRQALEAHEADVVIKITKAANGSTYFYNKYEKKYYVHRPDGKYDAYDGHTGNKDPTRTAFQGVTRRGADGSLHQGLNIQNNAGFTEKELQKNYADEADEARAEEVNKAWKELMIAGATEVVLLLVPGGNVAGGIQVGMAARTLFCVVRTGEMGMSAISEVVFASAEIMEAGKRAGVAIKAGEVLERGMVVGSKVYKVGKVLSKASYLKKMNEVGSSYRARPGSMSAEAFPNELTPQDLGYHNGCPGCVSDNTSHVTYDAYH